MKQYWELKSQVPDSLLFFRMGDFYELFAEDAIEASRILELRSPRATREKKTPCPWREYRGIAPKATFRNC